MADSASDLGTYWDSRADREAGRERDNPRKRLHTDLLWRLVEGALPGPGGTILDAGGGSGRFSIPLARRGYRVTHLDISAKMLEIASSAATEAGIDGIEFLHGDIVDLTRFSDAAFDLVLCIDSPLSFCFRRHEAALDELARVCRYSLVLCVISRLGVIAEGGMAFDLRHFGKPRTVIEVFNTGDLVVTKDLEKLQPLMPSWHAFTVEEIETLVTRRGFEVKSTMAPGALTTTVPPEVLTEVLQRADAYQELLDFEELFDTQKSVLGMAASGAGGIALSARKTPRP